MTNETTATATANETAEALETGWRYLTVATAEQAVADAVAANDKAMDDDFAAHEAWIATGCAPGPHGLRAESLGRVSASRKAELRRARRNLDILHLRGAR